MIQLILQINPIQILGGLDNLKGNALEKGEPSTLLLNIRLFSSFNRFFKLPTVSASSIHHISDSYYLRLLSEYFDAPQETHTAQDTTPYNYRNTALRRQPPHKKHSPFRRQTPTRTAEMAEPIHLAETSFQEDGCSSTTNIHC